MLAKIIFFASVTLATLVVILLAIFNPISHSKPTKNSTRPALSLYIQQTQHASRSTMYHTATPDAGALIFHRVLTEAPENNSQVVGRAQGFIIPIEHFAHSGFNIIYLTFDTREFSGSLSIQAKNINHEDNDELIIVGGTGSFAFARGLAVFAKMDQEGSDLSATYHIKLKLKFPNRSQTIPG